MAWAPTQAILTPRAIPDNLLTYCTDETRQTDAYTWAGDATLKPIKLITALVANRLNPIYPAVAFLNDDDAQSFDDDIINGAYNFTFELSIQNADPDTALAQARKYDKAWRSMILNCPAATMAANTGGVVAAAKVQMIETGFDEIKTNEKQNDFLQQFQIRVTCSLFGSAF